MQRAREHDIEVRGLRIHYLEWGERIAEPLILIHGFLDHAQSWQPLVTSLQRQSAKPLWIIAPDCRGHGDSGWVGDGGYYHFPDYLLDLDHLVQSLDAPSIRLMGHSMGGTISFLYSGTFPNRATKLILVEGLGARGCRFTDAPVRMEKWIAEVKALSQRKVKEYSSLEEAAKRLQRRNPRLRLELALEWARGGMKQKPNGTWVWKFDPLHRTAAPQPFYTAQALEFFYRIECSVLIVQGKESPHARRSDTQERIRAIKHQKMIEIDEAGHMVHLDNPEALAKAVLEFLRH